LPWHITIKVTMVLRFSFDAGASIAELVTSDSSYWVLKASKRKQQMVGGFATDELALLIS
jgi:hypothetical protein